MEKYMKELGYDLEGFTVSGLRAVFGHVYYIWRVFKEELGADKALATYGVVWGAIAQASFAQAVQDLGIKEVKDIATLGRIVHYCGLAIPAIYETVENAKDRHIGRVYWCANPTYGPDDCIYSRHEYYRNAEIPLTIHYLKIVIAEAKKMGLKDDVEISVPVGRCRDGEASFCQWHLWRKGSPRVQLEVVPDSEKRFIEDEMGDEEPILFVLRKQGKKLEDIGAGMLTNVIFVDMKAWDGLEANVGKERGLDIYKKLWLAYSPMWVKEAKIELKIGEVTTLEDLAGVIAYCEKKRFVPYMVAGGDGKMTLTGKNDPFAEIPTQFLGKKLGDSYFEAVAAADQEFINQVIKEAKMGDKVKVTYKKRLVQGDDKNEIVIEKK